MKAIALTKSRRTHALLLSLALLLPALLLADDDTVLDAAQTAFDAGRFRAAEIELKNLLRDDPGLVEARLLLAQVYLRTQQGAAAEKELRRAAERDLPAERWGFDLIEALLQQAKFDEALEVLDGETLPEDEQARALALRGRALLGLKQLEEAKTAFAAAAEADPADRVAASGLVQLALLTDDEETAERMSAALVERFPDESGVRLLRAEVLRRLGDEAGAVAQYDAVLEQEPENLRALLGRATMRVRALDFDAAAADLDAVEAIQPNTVIVSYLRGVIEFYQRDWDAAAEHLGKVIRVQPNHLQSQLLLGIVSYARNDLQIAEEYLSGVVAAAPGNLQAAKVLAATHLKLREPAAAAKVLEPLVQEDDPQVMALLGSAYMLAGDQEQGQAWLSRAVETAPDVAALRTQLALTLIAGGQTGDAISELESAVDLGQEVLQADVLLVLAHLKEKDYEAAIAASTALEERRPDSPIAFNLTGLALLAQGKHDEARNRFDKALALDETFTTALINLARVDVASGDLDGAAERYGKVIARDPRNLAALLGMAALAELRGDDPALQEWLNRAQDANAAAKQPGILLARYHIDRREPLKALTVASELATRFPDAADVLEMLGRAQTLADEEASAIRTFDQILEQQPGDPRILYLRGGAQWKAEDLRAAADSFRRAVDAKQDFVDARVALASVLLEDEAYDEALEVAKALQVDYPEQSLGYRIAGAVHLAAREPQAAIEPLQKALELQPTSSIVRQLAEAQVGADKTDDAVALLERWVSASPDDPGAQSMLAMLLHSEGQEDRALPIYERLYQAGRANLLILNNLAWLLHERGDGRALEIAREAYELNPNRPEVADTFGWILYNQGQRERGLSILQQAHLAYPTQTEIAYHTAVALDGMDRGEEALKILRRLLREYPNSDQAPDAQALFDRLSADGAG